MNRNVKIALNVVVWVILLAYLIVSARYCSHRRADLTCTGVNVVIKDSLNTGFLTTGSVRNILTQNGLKLEGVPLDSISPLAVEQAISSQPYVKKAKVYHSMDGVVHIEVEQRAPILRVQSENGYRFYLSSDGHVMPIRRTFFVDVPIVTGVPRLPFGTEFAGKISEPEETEKKGAENVHFLRNLINFVEFLKRDSFWGAQIVQINVISGNEVELIPRVGRGIILLGHLDDYEEKLDKLFKFYRQGLAYEGWNKYSLINLKFKDQVVCVK